MPVLEVEGQGLFTAQPSGGVRFAPAAGFVGTTVPVGYQVADSNGTLGTATLVVTVQARPVAHPDQARTKQHLAVVIDAIANDVPGPGAKLDPDTLLLVGPDAALVKQVTVAGQGEYVVADGKVTFSPEARFTGSTRPVAYEVKDSNRNRARSTLSVTVTPVLPVVRDDSARTAFDTAVAVDVLSNDRPGDASAPLRPASVVLRDPGDGRDKKTVTVSDEGVFAVGADGVITFTPVKDFIGSTRSLAYRVTDENGTTGSALLDVTVDPPRPAVAAADTATGSPGSAVAVNPSLNDSGGSEQSICLRIDPATCTRTATTEAGTWTVTPDGTIRLTPAPGFTGTAKLTYERPGPRAAAPLAAPVRFTIAATPTPDRPLARTHLPETGGPPVILLTLGSLLTALGATLAALARSRR